MAVELVAKPMQPIRPKVANMIQVTLPMGRYLLSSRVDAFLFSSDVSCDGAQVGPQLAKADIERKLPKSRLTRCGSRVGEDAVMHKTAFQQRGRV